MPRQTRRERDGQSRAGKMQPKPNRGANKSSRAVSRAMEKFRETGKNRRQRAEEKRKAAK